MKRKYDQNYRSEWEKDPMFSSWLSRSKDDNNAAFCKACNMKLVSRLSVLKDHINSIKHKKSIIGYSGQSSVSDFYIIC